MFVALELAGTKLPVRKKEDGQPFFLCAIEEILRLTGGPDFRAFYSSSVSFARGVRLGYKEKTPRVPSVFERKSRLRKYEEETCPWDSDRDNYVSARAHAAAVQQQFEDEAKLGAMERLSLEEARAKCGDRLAVASLGAIEKKNGAIRVIHDGTHGIGVNPSIVMRDQLRTPSAGEVRAVMQELPGCFFGLTGAHRLVKVAEAEWGLMACKSGVDDQLCHQQMGDKWETRGRQMGSKAPRPKTKSCARSMRLFQRTKDPIQFLFGEYSKFFCRFYAFWCPLLACHPAPRTP